MEGPRGDHLPLNDVNIYILFVVQAEDDMNGDVKPEIASPVSDVIDQMDETSIADNKAAGFFFFFSAYNDIMRGKSEMGFGLGSGNRIFHFPLFLIGKLFQTSKNSEIEQNLILNKIMNLSFLTPCISSQRKK